MIIIVLFFTGITFAADSQKGKGKQPASLSSGATPGGFLEVLGLEDIESFKNVPRSMEELEKLSASERARLLELLTRAEQEKDLRGKSVERASQSGQATLTHSEKVVIDGYLNSVEKQLKKRKVYPQRAVHEGMLKYCLVIFYTAYQLLVNENWLQKISEQHRHSERIDFPERSFGKFTKQLESSSEEIPFEYSLTLKIVALIRSTTKYIKTIRILGVRYDAFVLKNIKEIEDLLAKIKYQKDYYDFSRFLFDILLVLIDQQYDEKYFNSTRSNYDGLAEWAGLVGEEDGAVVLYNKLKHISHVMSVPALADGIYFSKQRNNNEYVFVPWLLDLYKKLREIAKDTDIDFLKIKVGNDVYLLPEEISGEPQLLASPEKLVEDDGAKKTALDASQSSDEWLTGIVAPGKGKSSKAKHTKPVKKGKKDKKESFKSSKGKKTTAEDEGEESDEAGPSVQEALSSLATSTKSSSVQEGAVRFLESSASSLASQKAINYYSTTSKEWFVNPDAVIQKYGYLKIRPQNEEQRMRRRIFLEVLRIKGDQDLALKSIIEDHTVPLEIDKYVMREEGQQDGSGIFRKEVPLIVRYANGTRKYGFFEIMSRKHFNGAHFIYHRFLREAPTKEFVQRSMSSDDPVLTFQEYFDEKEKSDFEKMATKSDAEFDGESSWETASGNDWIEDSNDLYYIFTHKTTGMQYYLLKGV